MYPPVCYNVKSKLFRSTWTETRCDAMRDGPLIQKTQLRHRWLAWTIALLLAFAVSGWGLHYKLSLYSSTALKGRGPAAKLLSQKERPVAASQLEQLAVADATDIAHRTVAAYTLAAWALVTLTEEAPCGRLFLGLQESPHFQALASVRPSAPRPPPITV